MIFSQKTHLGRVRHIHFVGLGGAGMCGIAEVLLNEGYKVSGSDIQTNANLQRLALLGATVYIGHHEENITDADVLVKSTIIKEDNPEIVAAHARRIPVLMRAQMLGELMRFRYGIAVAGTHGKTTTTSLITSVLTEAELDPTFVIGGLLNSAGANAKLGTGKYLVAEADESDASFLSLNPTMTIVTNIDADHMETYGGDFEKLRQTFLSFLENLPFYGLAILCLDDPVIADSLNEIPRPMITYGFDAKADIHVIPDSCTFNGWYSRFVVKRKNKIPLEVRLRLPGKHNILNACAAIAVAQELNISDEFLLKALANFSGVARRMQFHGMLNLPHAQQISVLDDYGHHPREVKVTLEALRHAYPHRRIVMVFQPHRYTRTRDLFNEFAVVLNETDKLFLLNVYAAGEAPINGADSYHLAEAIREKGKIEPLFIEQAEQLFATIKNILQDNDVLLFQGAGNIGGMAEQILKVFAALSCHTAS